MQHDGAKPTRVAAVTAPPATATGSGSAQGILDLKVGELEYPYNSLVKSGFGCCRRQPAVPFAASAPSAAEVELLPN